MPCKYNPLTSTHWHTIPRQWCNILWGECQFVEDSKIHLCPLHGELVTWYEWWIMAEPDPKKIVTLQIDGVEYNMSVGDLKKIVIRDKRISGVTGADIDCNGGGGGGGDVTDEELIRVAFIKGYVTIYHGDRLISIGEDAMLHNVHNDTIDLRDCRFIGATSFCESSVRTIDFSHKTDGCIPVLENINSFFDDSGWFPDDLTIIVPDSMYSAWIKEPNWITLKKYIKKASEI